MRVRNDVNHFRTEVGFSPSLRNRLPVRPAGGRPAQGMWSAALNSMYIPIRALNSSMCASCLPKALKPARKLLI